MAVYVIAVCLCGMDDGSVCNSSVSVWDDYASDDELLSLLAIIDSIIYFDSYVCKILDW